MSKIERKITGFSIDYYIEMMDEENIGGCTEAPVGKLEEAMKNLYEDVVSFQKDTDELFDEEEIIRLSITITPVIKKSKK